MQRFLVAPDSFKGTFSAPEVAAAIGAGLADGGAEADLCPVADGGEGTAEALRAALGGSVRRAPAHDPLGREIEGAFVLLDDGDTAAVDTAAASGLPRVDPAERDAEAASTYGTGAIEALRERGGIGASRIEVLCDVTTPFEDAALVFAPQKGADAAAVERLGRRLQEYAADLPCDPRGVAMGGCAGGLSGGLWAAFGAELRPGAAFVLDLLGFDQRLREADAAIAGEGRIDSQSFEGKVVGQIAERCAAAGRALHVVVGRDALGRGAANGPAIRSILEASTLAALRAAGRDIASASAT